MISQKEKYLLDGLEELVIRSFIPTMKKIREEIPELKNSKQSDYEMARAIIGNIGTRITFSPSVADQIILGGKKNAG